MRPFPVVQKQHGIRPEIADSGLSLTLQRKAGWSQLLTVGLGAANVSAQKHNTQRGPSSLLSQP